MGVERVDGLEAPGLALLAFCLGPHHGFPVRLQDEPGADIAGSTRFPAGSNTWSKKVVWMACLCGPVSMWTPFFGVEIVRIAILLALPALCLFLPHYLN